MEIGRYFRLNPRRFLLVGIAEFASIILHNAIYGFVGTEEAVFFILAVLVIPIYLVVALAYTMTLLHREKRLRKDWWLGFLGFLGFQGLNGLMKGDWWMAAWIAWFAWFFYFLPVRKK